MQDDQYHWILSLLVRPYLVTGAKPADATKKFNVKVDKHSQVVGEFLFVYLSPTIRVGSI